MQRHGYQIVNVLKQRRVFDGFAQLLTEKDARLFVASIFQFVNEVLHLTRLGKEETSRNSVKLDPSIEGLCQWVVRIELIARLRQQVAAFQANDLLILELGLATSGTHTRIEQVEDTMKPVAEGHSLSYCPMWIYFFRGTIALGLSDSPSEYL